MKASKVFLSSCAVIAWMTASHAVAAQVKKISPVDSPPVVRQYEVPGGTSALNQPPNGVDGFFSDPTCALCADTGQQSLADNLVVNSPGGSFHVNQIIMWGGYVPSNTPNATDVFTILIHQNSGGVPGPVVFSLAGIQATSRVQTGVILFGVNEWLYTFDLAAPPVLPNGTYWAEIINDTAGNPSGDDFFWETGDLDPVSGIPGAVFAFEAPGVNWNADPTFDLAIQINGVNVPVELQGFSVE